MIERKRYKKNFQEHNFFTEFEFLLRSKEKRAGFSNPVNNRVLESYSNIFFPLGLVNFNYLLKPLHLISHLNLQRKQI